MLLLVALLMILPPSAFVLGGIWQNSAANYPPAAISGFDRRRRSPPGLSKESPGEA
jgi:hypothetical protein